MTSYLVCIMEMVDNRMVMRTRIELNHLCPPVATLTCPEAPALLDMAKEGVSFQSTEQPKLRCDLSQMRLVEPKGES